MQLPSDAVGRFKDIYNALNSERGFLSDASPLRFAAVSALCIPGSSYEVADSIRSYSDEIKKASGYFGNLRSSLSFVISALLLQAGDTVSAYMAEVKRVRPLFRQLGLRKSGAFESIAILLLRLKNDLQSIDAGTVELFQSIYEEMKHYHWWLTGPEDFPACAALCGIGQNVEYIGAKVEEIYVALDKRGFAKGDQLQTAANTMFLAGEDANLLADRYEALASLFKQRGVSIWRSDYDELAILSFLNQSVSCIVDDVLQKREQVEKLRPSPSRSMTFNLAASLSFIELIQRDEDRALITDTKALLDMQNIIYAQQAASTSAATTAAVAASSSSH